MESKLHMLLTKIGDCDILVRDQTPLKETERERAASIIARRKCVLDAWASKAACAIGALIPLELDRAKVAGTCMQRQARQHLETSLRGPSLPPSRVAM
eukprot:308331-Amphidinium_carterae.1